MQVGCWDGTLALYSVQPAQSQGCDCSQADLDSASTHGLMLLLHFTASREAIRAVAWPPPRPEASSATACQGQLFAAAGQGQGISIWDARCASCPYFDWCACCPAAHKSPLRSQFEGGPHAAPLQAAMPCLAAAMHGGLSLAAVPRKLWLCRDPSQAALVVAPMGQSWVLDMAWLQQGLLTAQDDGSLQYIAFLGKESGATTQVYQ